MNGDQPEITKCIVFNDDGSENEVFLSDYDYMQIVFVSRIPTYEDGMLLPINSWETITTLRSYDYDPGNSWLTFDEIESTSIRKYFYHFIVYDANDYIFCADLYPLLDG